jgi:hypothetical protein
VLLLAMGDGKIDAPADRIVSWTWRLARAARDHEYRYAGAHIDDGRGLLGAVANAKTDAEHSQACLRLAQVAKAAPLEAGAALLAVASPRRGTPGEQIVDVARRALSEDPYRLATALGSNIPAPMQRAKAAKKSKRKTAAERGETVSFNGVVVGSTPPAVPLRRSEGAAEVEVSLQVAVRLRDDADALITERLGVEGLQWRLAGDERAGFATAVEARTAAAAIAPLQVIVPKLLNEPVGERVAPVAVDGAGLVVGLELDEAQVLADDAARRVLAQLKAAGVRGRVRVEFEVTDADGAATRDSRPGAVRKIARGEPVGASPERRDRRRRARGRRGRRAGVEEQARRAASQAGEDQPPEGGDVAAGVSAV